ncbi:DNA polymerase alpha catalytic subunit [Babesia duncani]|uniref:DNA polymerase alpha catalytic subunit n=1 Tax=Babesia duncani TaxID=323732 RepID=A0AAD9PHX7_9APIC|nr:DNA polymerase alpha catalytic subunit [Babesia duncani]
MAPKSRSGAVSSALSKIRNQRTGVTNALDEYEARDENEEIYEFVSQEEYEKQNLKRNLDDFIEGGVYIDDDDEFDYMDNELDDPSDLHHHRNPSIVHTKGEKSIQQHFVEIAQHESASFRAPKPVANDHETLTRLCKFEEDLENEDFGTATNISQLLTQQPHSFTTQGFMHAPRHLHSQLSQATQFQNPIPISTQLESDANSYKDFATQAPAVDPSVQLVSAAIL